MNWFRKRHVCEAPLTLPVIEEQRYWTCPDCGQVYKWTELLGGVGWEAQ